MKLSDTKKSAKPAAEAKPEAPLQMFDVTSKGQAEKLAAAPKNQLSKKPAVVAQKPQEVAGVEVKNATAPKDVAQENAEIKMQRVEWWDERYYYCQYPDGESERNPSSTHILGIIQNKQLVKWQVEVGSEEAGRRLREGGDKGTRIHHGCEILTNGGVCVYNPFNKPQYSRQELAQIYEKYTEKGVAVFERQEEFWEVMKFREWLRAVDPGVIKTEFMLCSRTHKFAGTGDYLFDIKEGDYNVAGKTPLHIEGGLWLTDLKSSKSLHDSYNLQTSSYLKAWEEMHPEYEGKIKGTLIIHTNAQTRTGIEGLTTVLRTRKQVEEDFDIFLSALKLWRWNNPTETPTIRDFPSIISLTTI